MKRLYILLPVLFLSAAALPACQADGPAAGDNTQTTQTITAESGDASSAPSDSGSGQDILSPESGDSGGLSHASPESGGATESAENQSAQDRPTVLKNLDVNGGDLFQTLYKAGDVNRCLSSYIQADDGDIFPSSTMVILLYGRPLNSEGFADPGTWYIHGTVELETAPGQHEYRAEMSVISQDGDTSAEYTCPVQISLPSPEDGHTVISVALSGDSSGLSAKEREAAERVAGEYMRMGEEHLFTRYLSKAELRPYPTEDLWVMRNTIYAAHGRKFKDTGLANRMENQLWYRGLIEPEDFSESVLSDVEKANVALIKEMEDIPGDQRAVVDGASYHLEDLDFAPYLTLLTENQETGVSFDMSQAEDCGSYYRVPGGLSLPVTMTHSQWLELQKGNPVEVCLNELTKEVWILEPHPEQGYLFYKKGAQPDPWGWSIGTHYNYKTNLYELYQDSDDTIMKPVYEGDIFVLKGAVSGNYLSLTSASAMQQEITPRSGVIGGNYLFHNGRGYLTAVYYLGD